MEVCVLEEKGPPGRRGLAGVIASEAIIVFVLGVAALLSVDWYEV